MSVPPQERISHPNYVRLVCCIILGWLPMIDAIAGLMRGFWASAVCTVAVNGDSMMIAAEIERMASIKIAEI